MNRLLIKKENHFGRSTVNDEPLNATIMEKIKFKHYEHRPCKFVFRNGKKVFGVIWESKAVQSSMYFFASNGDFLKLQSNQDQMTGMPIELDDVIYAELLQ